MNDFDKILFNIFESDETIDLDYLSEGLVPVNPMLAFYTFKKDSLNKLRNIGKSMKSAIDREARKIKSKAAIAKEKIRADLEINSGKGDDGTVYELTREQKDALSDVYKKYGNEIVKEIKEFRKNVLAPYQVIKRIVKKNKSVTAVDKFGMTHSEYKKAYENGLKKIEKRKDFFDSAEGSQEAKQKEIQELGKAIDSLREAKDKFKKTGELQENMINRVLRYYNLGSKNFESHLEDLRKTYAELKKNNDVLDKLTKLPTSQWNTGEIQNTIQRELDLRKGSVKKEREKKEEEQNENFIFEEEKSNKKNDLTLSSEFKKNGSFNDDLAKYMLRRNVIKELKKGSDSMYKRTYLSIFDKMIERASEKRKKLIDEKLDDRSEIEFNSLERKIFKNKKNASDYSGNKDDYVIMLKDEDFTNPEYIKRPKKLIEAEKAIEAEVKRFERALKKKIDEKDFNELKRLRLINNLISVRELKTPDKLFKDPEEIEKEAKKKDDSTPDKEVEIGEE